MKKILLLSLILMCGQLFSQNMTPPPSDTGFETKPRLLWKYKAGGSFVGSPVISNQTVFIGSLDSSLYAIDLATGNAKWRLPTGGAIRNAVCPISDRIFVLSSDGILYRVAQDSGKVDGFFQTMTGYMGDRQHDYADYFTSTPVILDSVIYFGSGEYVYALSITDGYLRWTFKTGGLVHTTPAFGKNWLYIGSFDGNIYAIDLISGSQLWKFKTTGKYSFPNGEVSGNPVVAKGLVVAGARDYNLYALDLRGGHVNWMKQFPYGWGLPLTVNDSVIYVGTSDDRTLFAYDIQTGREYWKTDAGFNIFGGCAIRGSTGIFGTLAGKIHGIDLKTGKKIWKIELENYRKNYLTYMKEDEVFRDDIGKILKNPNDMMKMYEKLGAIFGKPAVDGKYLVVAGYDGWVYCYTDAEEKKE